MAPADSTDPLTIARARIAAEAEEQTGRLDLNGLGLPFLPEELFALTHLRVLDLGNTKHWEKERNNRIGDSRQRLAVFTQLQHLDGSRTDLSFLDFVWSLSNLCNIVIAGTPVTDLMPLADCTTLQSLDCSDTKVVDLAPLATCTAFQSLDCAHTAVSNLAPLAACASLQYLYCYSTHVADLAPLAACTALRSLDCSHTAVSNLAPLAACTALQSLDCGTTEVSDLAPLAACATFQSLNCSYTQVADLAPLAACASLQYLYCYSTHVADLAPLAACTALRSLDCSHTAISNLAPLAACTALQSLDCSHTMVSNLAPLAVCAALESLSCAETEVADLAPLAACAALQSFSCADTEVADLAPLAACAALQFLDCFNTRVADLAPLAACAALQSLDCYNTRVADLAPLAACAALRSLDCDNTQVADLAPLAACAVLQSLDCSRCRLTSLPEELIHAPSLTSLKAYNMTIPGIPDGVLSADWDEDCLSRLRGWLADLAAGVAVVPGVKLLLLGNGRVGKTQIVRRLAGLEFEAESDSTHGIRIGDLALPGLPDTRLWVWDFGGQDIYHGTHALFLRSPAVLAVVWAEAMEGEPTHDHGGLSFRNHPLPYWLDIARHQGHPASPTLVVQTRCDEPGSGRLRPPADEELLAAARCVGHLRVSAAPPPRGFAALTEALGEAVAWQRERLGVPRVGLVWRKVQLRLEAMRAADQVRPAAERRRLLTIPEFEAICREEGGVTAPEHLLRYLDATGTVLHRPGLFDDRIILDQNWAMEAVYAVFDRGRGAYRLIRQRNRGRFTLDDLAHTVWAGYGPDDRRLFLSLMRSCGIAFRHRVFGEGDDEIEEFIAPELLPEREEGGVAARWHEGVPTETRVFKHPLLHGGLIRAIMAELGERAGPDALYWQGGLCGYEATTRSRFLIEERMTGPWQGEIVVRTQGGAAAELLARLVGVVEEQQQRLSLHPEPADQPPATRPAEPERPMTFTPEPGKDPDWYVSYAWGDDTPEGREREAVVDRLCAAAEAAGNPILRDKKALSHGDSISGFMRRLGAGSRVFVILSEKYLRSPACMFELSEIWRNCKHDKDLFRRTVRVYSLPCATIWTARDRIGHAIHWKTQHKELDDAVKEHGTTILGDHDHHALRQMGFFFTHVGDMLGTLADTVQPRSFDELVKHGFAP